MDWSPRGFLSQDAALHILVTGLLFGFCSGIVTRTAFRPVISISAICMAAIPSSLVAATRGDTTSLVLSVVFLVFLLGGVETAKYLYLNARRQITLRLDMATLARNDPLTQLLNRLGLREAFRQVIAVSQGSAVALHCLDLDGFKPVNDRYGHAIGDMLLVAIANRLRSIVPEAGLVARVGGDEFVIVQGKVTSAEEASAFADRLVREVREPFTIDGRDIEVGVSVGSVTSPPTRELEALIAAADAALYEAKKRKSRGTPDLRLLTADVRQRGSTRPLAS